MKKTIICCLLVCSIHQLLAQSINTPKKIGLVKEFKGRIISHYMFDGDEFFTLKADKGGEVQLYLRAGSCHGKGDPFDINSDIDEELMNSINSFDRTSSKPISVKVTAKSTYAYMCGTCDDCREEKQIIWRPVRATRMK